MSSASEIVTGAPVRALRRDGASWRAETPAGAFAAPHVVNAAGAWEDHGEDHDPETHLIPRQLRSLLVPGETFAVFGDDYATPDGTCIRDYIHVRDLAEARSLAETYQTVSAARDDITRSLLLNRMPDNADVAVVLNPQLSVVEFLATICEELHIEVVHNKGSVKALTDALNRHLLSAHAEGRRTILVVDEAQNLAPAVLEQVRLLTNLETAKQKLLQIILIGQPELRDLLARNDLRQLAQRITARYHLEPLSREETATYIEHRLKVAGALGEVFDESAKKEIYRLSQGVPRLINVICDRALLGAYSREKRRVNASLIREAASEVRGEIERSPWVRRAAIAAGIIGIVLIAASSWLTLQSQAPPEPVAEALPAVAEQREEAAPAVETNVLEPVVEEPAEPKTTLPDELRMAEDLTVTDYAFAALFDTWGLEYLRGARDGCAQATEAPLVEIVLFGDSVAQTLEPRRGVPLGGLRLPDSLLAELREFAPVRAHRGTWFRREARQDTSAAISSRSFGTTLLVKIGHV